MSANGVKSFDLDAIMKSDDYGYVLEVDPHDYPLAAEKIINHPSYVVPYTASLIDKHSLRKNVIEPVQQNKICTTLRNLLFYLNLTSYHSKFITF